MKCKIKNVKNKFLVILIICFLLFNQQYYYNNIFFENPNQYYHIGKIASGTSFTFTYNETFQTITYRNGSITNVTGWGKDFLYLPHQEIINVSNYNYDFDIINSIESEGNLLFIADNSNGLKILNISNPAKPTLISQYGDNFNQTLDVAIQGKYAYVADGLDGLEIVDISNPISIQKVNNWSNNHEIMNIVISNNLAFLSVQGLGIEILNISNPQEIIRLSNWTNNRNPSRVIIKDNHVFVANENYELEILDISDINDIKKVSGLPITNKPYQIQIKNNYIYLANGIEGLKIIDINDISNPNIITSLTQFGSITGIIIEENYALIINNTFGLTVIDIISPLSPILTYQWYINKEITFLEFYGDYIYIGCESIGLHIFKLSKIVSPKQIYKFSSNINVHNVILSNDRAYVCAVEDGVYDGGLFIFDISNPFNPQQLGNFSNLGFDFYDIEILGEICFATTYNNGLISLNISDPTNINILDSVSGYLLNFSQNIEIFDNLAYVANGFIGLDVYNISDPFNLQYIINYPGDLSSVGVYSDVKIRDECAFVAKSYEGLEILNISNLNNIKSIANYTDSYNNSLALEFWGNYLLVADRFDGLEILDISDVKNPQKISQYTDTYNRALKVKVLDNLAIISDRADGVEIINISNPLNPVEVASYSDSYNNSRSCAVTRRFLYIADAHDGLQIIQYKEHLFNQYKKSAVAQSLEIDNTIATITNATMTINGEIPDGTSIQSFLSNDNGNNWDPVTNNTLHNFSTNGSELIWKVIISTTDDLESPKLFSIIINYSAINTPPIILNQLELQNLAIWDQQEDFGFFEIDLSSHKDDYEFSAEYLYWSVINLNDSLVSMVQDNINKDIFRFYSIENVYGNDQFGLLLEDEAGAGVSINISLNIYSVNDPPFFIVDNFNILQDVLNDLIYIEYEANDVDNILIELNYSIYYGSGSSWNAIIKDYNKTTYTWNTRNVPGGSYHIKIVVSDGSNDTIWISPQRYIIEDPYSAIIAITLFSVITGAGIALFIFFLVKFRILKKIPKDEPIR